VVGATSSEGWCLAQIGSFFMINLCLVVIATQFSETKKRETARMWAERQQRTSSSSATLASADQLGSCYDEMLRYVAHLARVAHRRARALWRRCRPRRRRRRRQAAGDRDPGDETVLGAAHDGTASPRRLLRFDDQSAASGSHDAARLNGCPVNAIAEEVTTVNGQLPSCAACVTDQIDANRHEYFCSNADSSAHQGAPSPAAIAFSLVTHAGCLEVKVKVGVKSGLCLSIRLLIFVNFTSPL